MLEKFTVFQWKICRRNGCAPLKTAAVSFCFPIDNFKKISDREGIPAVKSNFITFVYCERNTIKKHPAVYRPAQFFDIQYLISHLTLRRKNYSRVFPVARFNFFNS